jgi:pantoate--beta-alanine ligase
MDVIRLVGELQKRIGNSGLAPVGLVPTMGALHDGHISLVRNAIAKCPLVVVSIYVNPTQFNDKEDLKNYPRTPEQDEALLGKYLREKDIIFIPDDNEIYPAENRKIYHFGNLDNVMEALHRPGHFNGVAMVVNRLFEIVKPDYAYFGQKDFQQLAVIKELVRQTNNKVSVIGNPIIREKDGVAMSSRNILLEPEFRKNAGIIYRTLSKAAEMTDKHEIPEIKKFVRESIGNITGFSVEYFEIADDIELVPLVSKSNAVKGRKYFGCIAVKAGKIRLIDNIEFPLQ